MYKNASKHPIPLGTLNVYENKMSSTKIILSLDGK